VINIDQIAPQPVLQGKKFRFPVAQISTYCGFPDLFTEAHGAGIQQD
jgi:hypothetical protein